MLHSIRHCSPVIVKFCVEDLSPVHGESIRRYIAKIPDCIGPPIELSKFLRTTTAKRHYAAALANYLTYAKESGLDYSDYTQVIRFDKSNPDLNIPDDSRVATMLQAVQGSHKILGLLLAYIGLGSQKAWN